MQSENIYSFPTNIQTNQELITDAIDFGCLRAKIVLTSSISLGSWVHLKCQFGCSNYGNILTCPPYSPSSTEMGEVLMEYKKALLIEVDDSTDTNNTIVQLEERLKRKGFYKAFAICAVPCSLCTPCTTDTQCKYPEKARPTFQACGIDVRTTLIKNGWSTPSLKIEPCSPANNIAMLLID